MTIVTALAIAAFILTLVAAATARVPLWVPVLLVCICLVLQTYGGR